MPGNETFTIDLRFPYLIIVFHLIIVLQQKPGRGLLSAITRPSSLCLIGYCPEWRT